MSTIFLQAANIRYDVTFELKVYLKVLWRPNEKPRSIPGTFWLKMENPKVYQGPFLVKNHTPKVYQRANFETLNIVNPLSLYPIIPPGPFILWSDRSLCQTWDTPRSVLATIFTSLNTASNTHKRKSYCFINFAVDFLNSYNIHFGAANSEGEEKFQKQKNRKE